MILALDSVESITVFLSLEDSDAHLVIFKSISQFNFAAISATLLNEKL